MIDKRLWLIAAFVAVLFYSPVEISGKPNEDKPPKVDVGICFSVDEAADATDCEAEIATYANDPTAQCNKTKDEKNTMKLPWTVDFLADLTCDDDFSICRCSGQDFSRCVLSKGTIVPKPNVTFVDPEMTKDKDGKDGKDGKDNNNNNNKGKKKGGRNGNGNGGKKGGNGGD